MVFNIVLPMWLSCDSSIFTVSLSTCFFLRYRNIHHLMLNRFILFIIFKAWHASSFLYPLLPLIYLLLSASLLLSLYFPLFFYLVYILIVMYSNSNAVRLITWYPPSVSFSDVLFTLFYLFILFIYIYTYFFPHLLFPLPSEGIHSVIFPFLQLFLFLISYNPKLDCTQKGSHTCSVLYSNYNTFPNH